MRMSDPVKTIQDAIGIHQEAHRIGYDAGLRAGLAKLDQAWAEITALAMRHSYDWEREEENYNEAIIDALNIIEKLGGMDPIKRRMEWQISQG